MRVIFVKQKPNSSKKESAGIIEINFLTTIAQ
jgi:hypothetical protein